MTKFTSKLSTLVAGLLLYGFSSYALAISCTSSTSWGSMGPPDFQTFGNSFSSAGSYADCYTFSLSGNTNSFGGVLAIDPWLNKLDIDVTGVSLFNGGLLGGATTGGLFGADLAPTTFGFGSLTTGTYSLVVFTNVTHDLGLLSSPVSYFASITTYANPTSVPEPGVLALFALGLVGIAVGLRRRKA